MAPYAKSIAIYAQKKVDIIIHSHITGKILLYTTTRRKIPNILGNWHMKFNSPLLKLSYMMLNNGELINSPRVGNWNCLYCEELKSFSVNSPCVGNWNCLNCGEIKSCYINSPHVEDWNSKFCVQYGNVSPSPRRKRDWVKFPICHSWQSHSWLIGNFIFHHLWLRHYVVKNPIPFSPR